MRRIYLASSWRNNFQPDTCATLRSWGHEVYDFRNPPHGPGGFKWDEIDPDWRLWSVRDYKTYLLGHSRAAQGWMQDHRAMEWCDTCVMLLPCGNSAHIELGVCIGKGKQGIIYIPPSAAWNPDLMYLEAHAIAGSLAELEETLQ